MKRLFGCTVTLAYKEEYGEAAVNSLIARRGVSFGGIPTSNSALPGGTAQSSSAKTCLTRSSTIPVPLDMNTLKALKRSASGPRSLPVAGVTLPGVCTSCSVAALLEAVVPPVRLADPAKAPDKRAVQDFRRKVLRELKKIKLAWPDLNYTTAPGVLILHPSTPAIAPLSHLTS